MKILKLTEKSSKRILKEALDSLTKGGVLVFPTDTVYGLIADATNEKAVEKIFKIKKRKTQMPIPIFVSNLEMSKKFAKIGKDQEKFLQKVWPGKVTVILKPENKKLSTGIGKDNKEIGIRIPRYKLLNELLKRFKKPLAQTSANISGKTPPINIKDILGQFKGKYQPDIVIDAGILKERASLILDLTKSSPKILRL